MRRLTYHSFPKTMGHMEVLMQNDQRLANIDAEIARVQKDIEAKEKRLHDLTALKILLTEYIDVVGIGLMPISSATAMIGAELLVGGKKLTKQRKIIEGCKEILADGRRRFARELLVELEKRGVSVGGKNPKSNLSSYLSHDDAFQADTKLGGWTLRRLIAPKAKASNARTVPAFSTNGALPERHQLAGSPREGGLQFD